MSIPQRWGRPLQTSGDNWGMTKAESSSPPEGVERGVAGLAGVGSFPSRKGAGPPPPWAWEPRFQMTMQGYRKQHRHMAIRWEWLCVQTAEKTSFQPWRGWFILGEQLPVITKLKLTFQVEVLSSGIFWSQVRKQEKQWHLNDLKVKECVWVHLCLWVYERQTDTDTSEPNGRDRWGHLTILNC